MAVAALLMVSRARRSSGHGGGGRNCPRGSPFARFGQLEDGGGRAGGQRGRERAVEAMQQRLRMRRRQRRYGDAAAALLCRGASEGEGEVNEAPGGRGGIPLDFACSRMGPALAYRDSWARSLSAIGQPTGLTPLHSVQKEPETPSSLLCISQTKQNQQKLP